MSDIVERLRYSQQWEREETPLHIEAADEITRLRAERAEMLAELKGIVDWADTHRKDPYWLDTVRAIITKSEESKE